MPYSIPGSVMATLDLGIEPAIVSSVYRTRRPGSLFWLAVGWTIFVLAASVLADVLLVHGPFDMDMLERRASPSLSHWLGTDGLGRDELARLVYGARMSLTVGLCAPIIGISIGGALGILAGYFRGRFETTIGRAHV